MKKKLRSAFLLESLEPRLLFSADMAPVPVDGGIAGAENGSDLEISLRPDSGGMQASDTAKQERREVVFVDEAIDDVDQLIADLESQLEKRRQFDVVALDTDHDGIAQISAYLSQHQDVAAVHIISHGGDGEVTLGNSRLNATTLDGYAEAIEGWQQSLAGDADLLFYGCNLAAGDDGQELVNSLTLLTGADVAASNDVTGSAKFGGDWELEYSKGEIETAVAVSNETQQDWGGVLATFTVDTTDDTPDANLMDVNALDLSGNTSLRAAIMQANDLGGNHTIVLGAGTYTLTIGGTGEDMAVTGDLDITADITINGADAAVTIIDADSLDRVFHLKGSAANLTLTDLTVKGGSINDKGGGIYIEDASAQLTTTRVVITGNMADDGAGIFNEGTMTLTDVVISNNGDATTQEGGGIHNKKVAILNGVTLSGNRADKGGGDGGGIFNNNGSNSLSLTNVTVSGNSAHDQGGGLHTETAVTILNSTFTLNSANSGGGISNNGGTVNIKNTIVAENLATSDPDVEGAFNSQDNNLIGDKGSATGFTDGVNGDQVGSLGAEIDPLLGPLRDNGGFTQTHAITAASPAYNAGTTTGAPPNDQRGISRDTSPDIGAFELAVNVLIVDTTSDSADAPDASTITNLLSDVGADGKISLREAIMATNGTANLAGGADRIHFQITDVLVGGAHTITVGNGGLPGITDAVVIDGTTDTDYSGSPIIELDGSTAGVGTDGLVIGNGTGLGSGSTIRGLVINRFNDIGIWLNVANDVTIEGNFIGTDVTGTLDRGNGVDGIDVENSDRTQIGGTTAAARNIISWNTQDGIWLHDGTNDTVIEGNFIGTDVSGLNAAGNILSGIRIFGDSSDSNRIGGTAPGAGNLISGNFGRGIILEYADFTEIYGNLIGTDVRGMSGIGNGGSGIHIVLWSNDNTIGGTNPGEANVIAFNGLDGIHLDTARNTIRTNVIFGNSAPNEIHLTPNGNPTVDTPSVSNATSDAGITSVTVSVPGASAGTPFEVDLFGNSTNVQEGQVYLGSVTVTGDPQVVVLNTEVANNHYITATATNTVGAPETSQFSGATKVTCPVSVNTAPILDPSINVALNPYLENAGPPIGAVGTLVRDLVDLQGGGGKDNITDPDVGAVPGIAVISADTSNGTWHYSTDNGTSWFALGAVSIDSARLLAANDASTRIYFQPNPSFSGSISEAIYFRAWDQTDVINVNGTAGVDTTIHGGTTAFSLMFDSASIMVMVNNEPTLTTTADNPTFTEGDTAAGLFSATSVSTVESGQTITGLTLTVTNVNDGGNEKLNIDGSSLALTDGNSGTTTTNSLSYSISVSGTTATVTLTGGTLSTAATETLVDAVSYLNDSDNPDTSNRVVTITQLVDSGGCASGGDDTATLSAASTVTVLSVNDNPTGSGSLSSTSLNDNAGATNLFSGLTVSDVDAGESDLMLRITLSSASAGTITGGGFTDLGGGVYTATGLTVAQANTALDNVQFTPADNTGDSGSFITDISVDVDDQGGAGYQSVLAATTVTINRVNDNPTGSGSLTATSLNDNAGATNLFSGLTVSDVDAGESDLMLRITLSSASAGTITGGGFTDLGGGVYTATGLTVAQANTALDNVQFTPADNTGDSGSFITDISVDVDDQGGAGYQSVLAATTVTINRVNDNPTGSGSLSSTSLNDNAGATNLFSGLTVSDADTGESDLTLRITLSDNTAGTITGGGFTDQGGGVYTATGLTVSGANTALDNVQFTPTNNSGPAGNFTTNISVDVDDQGGAGYQSVLAATTVTINRVNDNPTGSGSLTATSLNDNAGATNLFSGLTVSDADTGESDLTLRIALSDDTAGTITGGGFTDLGGGVYTATGLTVTQANTALDNVQFTPADNTGDSGSFITDISVDVDDQGGAGYQSVLAATTVTINRVNDNPTGSGSLTATSLNDNAGATNLFSGLTVSDVDAGESDLRLRITLSSASAGTITGGGFTDLGGGVYTATGLTVAQANTALDNVQFTPADNTGDSGSFITDISVDVDDQGGAGYQSVLAATTVTINRVNDNPTGSGSLSSTSLNDNAGATNLFSGLTVSDADTGESDLTLRITLSDNTAGTITGGGFTDQGGGVYTATGLTVSGANTALDNVQFTPTNNSGPAGNFTTNISVDVDDQGGAGYQSVLAATTVTINRVNDNPTGSGSLTATSLNDNAGATNLFSGLTVSDADTGESDLTLRIALSDDTAGTITGGGFTDLGGGVYTATGLTVTQANTALDNVQFTPADNTGDSGSFITDISVDVDDQGGAGYQSVLAATTVTINRVNDNPTGSGSLTATSLNDNAGATNLFSGLTVSDVDAGESDLMLRITLSSASAGTITGGGFTDLGGGVYTATGLTVAQANTALDNVQFTPADNTGDSGSFITDISVDVDDQGGAGYQSVLAATTVTINRVNDNPTGSGSLSSTSLNDNAGATNLFSGLTVSDADTGESDLTLRITLSDNTAGTITGGGFTDQGGGVYTATGLTVSGANTALDNVQFTPTNNSGPAGNFTTNISVDVDDQGGAGYQSVLAATTVTITRVNDAPVLVNNNLTITEGATVTLDSSMLSATDVDHPDPSLTFNVTGAIAGYFAFSSDTATSITSFDQSDVTGGTVVFVHDGSEAAPSYSVSVTDGTDNSGPAPAVINFTNINDPGTVTIDNTTPAQGDTLTANVIDPDGASGAISYQWFSDGVAIGSAIAKTYTTTQADVGTIITVTALYTDDLSTPESLTSAPTVAVTNINDPGSVTIDNATPAQGDTLTANVTDADGASGAISYQWFSDGVAIGSATGKTYTTTQAYVGTGITVTANYTDDLGTIESLTSAPTAAVINVNDAPVAVNDDLNATEDQPIAFASITDLLGNDSDIEGDALTLSGFTQPTNGTLVDNGDGTLTYTPAGNFYGTDSFTYTINDGKGGTASGSAIIAIVPVGDTPQVTNVSTSAEVQSGLIYIYRNASDGAEVSHFKISGVTNGTLYLADDLSQIDNGDYITAEQALDGLKFTPTAGSTADGSFNVESSEGGVSVSAQSGMATSTITVVTPAPPPSAPQQGPPLSEPEIVVSEEVVQEETEDVEDLTEETDVSADADNIFSAEKPQTFKAAGIAKSSFNPGISFLDRADSDSDDDKSPDRSMRLSPQTLKLLIEAKNLGELKAALGKVDIATLSPNTYELMRNSLDAIKDEIGKEILLDRAVLGSAIATSVGLSAGYVVWMLKGGSLLASLLSSLPAWQLADPLAILVGKKEDDDDEDNESLETIIEEGSGQDKDKDKKTKASELNNIKKESAKR